MLIIFASRLKEVSPSWREAISTVLGGDFRGDGGFAAEKESMDMLENALQVLFRFKMYPNVSF